MKHFIPLLLLLVLLTDCVHETGGSGGTGFATSISSSKENGKVLKVETVCRGATVDGINAKNEPRIQLELTANGNCWRKSCREKSCTEAGNAGLPGESKAADADVAEIRTREKRELEAKFGEACAQGRGDYDACFELAARLDKSEIDRINKNLCARPGEVRCTKHERRLTTGSFTVNRLVTDLNCLARDGATVCTYTDIQPAARSKEDRDR